MNTMCTGKEIISHVNLILPGNIFMQSSQQDHCNHSRQEQNYNDKY